MGRRKGIGGAQGEGGGGWVGWGGWRWWLLQTETEARLSFHAGIMLRDLQLPAKNSLEIPYISETNYPQPFKIYKATLAGWLVGWLALMQRFAAPL